MRDFTKFFNFSWEITGGSELDQLLLSWAETEMNRVHEINNGEVQNKRVVCVGACGSCKVF